MKARQLVRNVLKLSINKTRSTNSTLRWVSLARVPNNFWPLKLSPEVHARREQLRSPASNDVVARQHAPTAARLRENIPKSKGFITSSSHYRTSVGRHREVQNSVGVARQGRYFLHRRVLPHNHLVQRVPVSTHQFVVCL